MLLRPPSSPLFPYTTLFRSNAGQPGVAIAGTSGKSTVTGMLAWLLRESGRPATVLGGAGLAGEGGSSCFTLGPADAPKIGRASRRERTESHAGVVVVEDTED